jgi:hypothetical protein
MQRQASGIILNLSNRAATARYQGVEKQHPDRYLHRHIKGTPDMHVERTKRKVLNVSLQSRLDVDHRTTAPTLVRSN